MNDEAVDEAMNVVSGDPSMLGEVLAAALDKRDFGYDSMSEAAETVGAAEHNKYMTQISWLSLARCYRSYAGSAWYGCRYDRRLPEDGQLRWCCEPSMLANDIGGAMITTATGLIIAIPMMFFFFFLRARINACVLDAGVLTAEILDYFRPRSKRVNPSGLMVSPGTLTRKQVHMAKKKKLAQPDIKLDLTPMIDVIFLLIIFFILAGKITAEISNENITVPPTDG